MAGTSPIREKLDKARKELLDLSAPMASFIRLSIKYVPKAYASSTRFRSTHFKTLCAKIQGDEFFASLQFRFGGIEWKR